MHNILIVPPSHGNTLPINLCTVCSHYIQEDVDFPSGRNFYQILFVVDGTGILTCNNTVYHLKKGCAFFTAAKTGVSYKSTNNLITAFLTVTGNAMQTFTKHFKCNGFSFREKVNIEKYLSDLDAIRNEYYKNNRNGIISALAYTVFANFFEEQNQECSQMKEISLYLEKNYTKKLSLKDIADTYNISVSNLSHNFKKEFNCTIFEFIINLRLLFARQLLFSSPTLQVKDIAYSCGFESVSYFCQAYKKKFGIPPSKTRN